MLAWLSLPQLLCQVTFFPTSEAKLKRQLLLGPLFFFTFSSMVKSLSAPTSNRSLSEVWCSAYLTSLKRSNSPDSLLPMYRLPINLLLYTGEDIIVNVFSA